MPSFYVKKRTDTKWSLHQEIHTNGKISQPVVPKEAYPALGIGYHLTTAQARERVKQINKEKKLDRHKAAKVARRLATVQEYHDVYFPQHLVTQFCERLRRNSAGSEDYITRLFGCFKFAQKMILQLEIQPHDYEDKSGYFYQYFTDAKITPDYAQEIINVMNVWGRFSSKSGGAFFEPCPAIPKKFRRNIARAQKTKTGVRTKGDRFTPELLSTLKGLISDQQYDWLFTSMWLGLRPSEVDREKGKPIVMNHPSNPVIKVLEVDQIKIETDDDTEGLKYIPILFDEQKIAMDFLKSGLIERPTAKKLKKVSGRNIDLYSARNGFIDLMQNKGQRYDDASLWIGHTDIRTTLKHYKNKSNVPFTELK